MRLYHYACHHTAPAIVAGGGVLRPNPEAGRQKRMAAAGLEGYAYPVVWVTDVDVRCREDAAKVGLAQLGGNVTQCDRVAFRFRVPNVGVVPWPAWADLHADQWAPPSWRELLEASPGAEVEHWYVSPVPLARRPAGRALQAPLRDG